MNEKEREYKKPAQNCDHQWKRSGFWDGEEMGEDKKWKVVNGPLVNCTKCGVEKAFTWKEWNALPKEIRI